MKRMTRLLSALLCLCLLLGMAACGQKPPATSTPAVTGQTTVPVTTTQPTQPTQPADLSALQYYAAALDLLSGRESLRMLIDRVDEVSTPGQTVETVSNQTVLMQGLQTNDLRIQRTEKIRYGTYSTEITETYVGGKAYADVYDNLFVSVMKKDDYTARLMPTIMIDGSRYGTMEVEAGDSKVVLHFRDALQLEAWLDSEANELEEAWADVTLNKDGSLDKVDYSATYLCSNRLVTTTVTVYYRNCTEEPITAPAGASDAAWLEYLDGPRMVEQVFGYLNSYNNISFSSNTTTYVSAANFYLSRGYDVEVYDFASNPQIQVDTNVYYMDYNTNESMEEKTQERYLNYKYTISYDGGEPQPATGVTTSRMQEYVMDIITEYVLDCGYFTKATCTDLGSLLLIEFGGNKQLGQIIADEICQEIYQDPDLLNNLASSFRLETMEYYIAVDKYLGIPTAMGMNFKGVHTIDGYEYVSIRQVDQSIYLDSLDAYKAIHDVAAPDEEPEEKATPVFYRVTGPNGQQMWLFGTIHVGDHRTGYLPQEIYDAFNQSDALAVECDSRIFQEQMKADPDLQQEVSGLYYYSDGSTAQNHITNQEIYDLAVKMMKATGNYFHNAPYLKVAMWSNSISNFFIRQGSGLSSDKGVDNRLLELADLSGKKILEVESSLFQLKMLTGWSDGLSQWQLADAVDTHGVAYTQSLLNLYELWCSGDEAALTEYLKSDTTGLTDEELAWWNEYNTAMSTDRNADMVKTAIGYLESGETVFMAVGLAHLLAEDGLVNALRAAGYTVELVEYQG